MPGLVGGQDEGRAFGELDLQEGDEAGGVRRIASVLDRGGKEVFAGVEQVEQVEGGGGLEIVTGPGLLPIDEGGELVIGCHEPAGGLDTAAGRQVENTAEVAGGDRRGFIGMAFREPDPRGVGEDGWRFGLIEADPFGLPIAGGEQAHRPARRFAPGRGVAVLVPRADFPEALLAGAERNAGVGNLDGASGHRFAGVPQVTPIGLEILGGGGDQDLEGGLALVAGGAFAGLEDPAQTGLGGVNAKRVAKIFAAQLLNRQGRGGQVGGDEKREQDEVARLE